MMVPSCESHHKIEVGVSSPADNLHPSDALIVLSTINLHSLSVPSGESYVVKDWSILQLEVGSFSQLPVDHTAPFHFTQL